MLGDLTDKRDRHPSDLVNRLIETLRRLVTQYQAQIILLCGNHDRALYAKQAYWSFLSAIPGIRFVRQPTAMGAGLLLPYTDEPKTEWDGIDFSLYKAAFCHLTMKQLESGVRFPKHLQVYSGDEHEPKSVHGVTYVGAAHPVDFGDDYNCRMLQIDDRTFKVVREIKLHTVAKKMIDITSVDQLRDVRLRKGDQAKIRLALTLDQVGDWQQEQAKIVTWAAAQGVQVASIEPVVETQIAASIGELHMNDPKAVLTQFAKEHSITKPLLATAYKLLDKATGEGT